MQKLHHLMHKEMSRKEFLTTAGFGLATLFGFSALLSLMGKENPWQQRESTGYGGGAYGGRGPA